MCVTRLEPGDERPVPGRLCRNGGGGPIAKNELSTI